MSSLLSILGVARDGIFATSAAMNVTSENVAGASTPGYVRRLPQLESDATGGVQMTGVTRTFDRFSYTQLIDQESQLSRATSRSGALADIESIVSPSTDTLADRANTLLSAFHDLASRPSDMAARTSVLSDAQSLAQGFSELSSGLVTFRDELRQQAGDVVSDVNGALSQLGELDQQLAQGQANGDADADVRDRRDQLVRQIANDIGARSIDNPDGTITLFGAGGVLYEGGKAATLSSALDANGNLQILASRDGTTADITNGVEDGKLGGIRSVRDTDIPREQQSLDSFAYDLSNTLNGIHAAGYGLDGRTGRNLFAAPTQVAGAAGAMALDPSLVGHPELLAAAANAGDVPGGNDVASALANAGSLSIGGQGTIAERYGALANDVGVARAGADAEEKLRTDTVATATTLRESASGVSVDEEMVNLTQFQRAFQASSQVLKTVNDLFDNLLGMTT